MPLSALPRPPRRPRRVLFPGVEVIVLRSLFDEQHESAAVEAKVVLRLRGLGLRVPVLVVRPGLSWPWLGCFLPGAWRT